MTDLLKAIGKHVAREIKSQPEPPERTEQMLFMYNRVDRRTKAYKDWITGKLSLSEAYAMAKDAINQPAGVPTKRAPNPYRSRQHGKR